MTKLIIATPEEKHRILLEKEQENQLEDFKFLSLSELKELLYGTYRDDYLLEMRKRGYLPSVANSLKEILWYTKEQKTGKLKELEALKKELIEEKVMMPATYQKTYLKRQSLLICAGMKYQIPTHILKDLEKEQIIVTYEEETMEEDTMFYHEFTDVREEISCLCTSILNMVQDQVPLDQIHICNVSSDYLGFCIHLLELYQIPYTIKEQKSIYSLPLIQDFLKSVETKEGSSKQLEEMITSLSSKNEVEQDAIEKLARVYGKYRHQDVDIHLLYPVLVYEIKHLYLKAVLEKNAVTIDSGLEDYGVEDIYFIVGFHQETMPPVSLDLDYINDEEKRELGMMDTTEKNERNKNHVLSYLFRKKKVMLSYAKGSSFANFERSPLLEELESRREIKREEGKETYRNLAYNRYLLARSLDTYYKYQEKNSDFKHLFQRTFIEDYQSYENKFQGVNETYLKEYLKGEMTLSYSSMDTFFHCPFRFYLRHILKVPEKPTGKATMIGTFFHEVLSKLYQEEEIDACMESSIHDIETFTKEEQFYLEKYQKELREICLYLKKEMERTEFEAKYFEKEFAIELDETIKVRFMGVIDKIMIFEGEEETYVIVVDYKTGNTKLDYNKVIYGLDMQLLVYLYFLKHHSTFSGMKVAGFYLQHILPSVMNYDEKKSYALQRQQFYQLDGYTIDQISLLHHLDQHYLDGGMIKSLRVTKNNTFYSTAKVIDEETIDRLLEIVDRNIHTVVTALQKADFSIAPIQIGNEKKEDATGCRYCQYYDICFKKANDFRTVKEYKNLEFLEQEDGGEKK